MAGGANFIFGVATPKAWYVTGQKISKSSGAWEGRARGGELTL